MSRVTGGNVKIAVAVEGQALRTSETAVKNFNFSALSYAIDAVETGSRGAGDIQIAAGMKCQMVGGERRLKGGEDKDFTAGTDFKNCSAAIADVKIFVLVEGDSGGYAHAFDPLLAAAVGSNAVDGTVVAAGYEEVAGFVDGEASGINQRGDNRLDAVVGGDFVERTA